MAVRVTEIDGGWRGEFGSRSVTATTRGRCIAALRRMAGSGVTLAVEVVPALVGVAEAAELLGWDRRRVATYVDRGTFPEPVARLACGQVWRRDDVEAFGATRRVRRRADARRAPARRRGAAR